MVIRNATRDDVGIIFELIQGLAEYEKLSHEVVGTVENLVENLFGEQRFAEVILAEKNGAVVGFALFFHTFSTFLCRPGMYLEDLYVRPEFRGQGAGLALISHVAKIAHERGCGRFEWSVLDWNESAIRFYESLGAQKHEGWNLMRVTGADIEKLSQISK